MVLSRAIFADTWVPMPCGGVEITLFQKMLKPS